MESAAYVRWNVFAATLDDILRSRGMRLGQLDDRSRVDPPIHPEKVRRLKQSLHAPKHFHVLSADEIDLVVQALGLSTREKILLRAAMLATAVEAILMGRIPPQAALTAAETLLPVIEQALLDYYGEFDDTIRGDDDPLLEEDAVASAPEDLPRSPRPASAEASDDRDQFVELAIDSAWAEAMDLIERAHLTLVLAELTDDARERHSGARVAHATLTHALTLLVDADPTATWTTTAEETRSDVRPEQFWPAWATTRRDCAARLLRETLEDEGSAEP